MRRRRTQCYIILLFFVAVQQRGMAQLNHAGLQFSRMTGEFPDFITISDFDDDFVWQTFFTEPVRSVGLVYSRSLKNEFSYTAELGYTSFVYGLATSESFFLLSEVERQYHSRYLSPALNLHYHLPKPLNHLHVSGGLLSNILLRSNIFTWRLQENGSLVVDKAKNENINSLILIPRMGLHYSIGNETIRVTFSGYANVKLNSFYASFNETADRFASSFSIAGYLNLNRFIKNKRQAEYDRGLIGSNVSI